MNQPTTTQMKTGIPKLFVLIALSSLAKVVSAQTFDSGSDGSHGALVVRSNTVIDLPADGVLHYTSVDIGSLSGEAITVSFRRNAFNTPVYLLSQGAVALRTGADIVLNGSASGFGNPGVGGPGGFDGGFGAIQGRPASDGHGPGAGTVAGYRSGVFAFARGQNTNVYGNTLLVPLIGGSGGSGDPNSTLGGGGGGGAVLIASSTLIYLNAGTRISCNGGHCGNGNGAGGAGSGGAIRLVAPVVDGTGRLEAAGGSAQVVGNHGSAGRIRIDTLNRFAWQNLTLSPYGEKWTVGSQMVTGLSDSRRLDIMEAAGTVIPMGTTNRVVISLPPGSSTNQTVKVRASGFTNDVPITVAVIPEIGGSTRFDTVIPVTSPGPVTNVLNVVIPVDAVTHLQVWSR